MCSGHVSGGRGKVSEQEKVDEIISCDRFSVCFDVFAFLHGFTRPLTPFFKLEVLDMCLDKAFRDMGEDVERERRVHFVF